MSDSKKQFENEHISLTVEHLDNCFVKLDISTKALATQAARTKATKTIAKEVNIPGFRKGKAPIDLISKQFSSSIDKETKDIILRNALDEAVKLCHIHPYSEKKGVKLIKFDQINQDAYEIVVEFEAFPEVPSIKIDELIVEKPEKQDVQDSDIENRIEELRIYHATWEEVERPVAENDFVTIDFDVVNNDESTRPIYRDSRFHLKEKKIPAWAKTLILGQTKNTTVEGMSEQEEGTDGNFHPQKCRITIKKIEEAILPSLDDELAKKAGVDTVDDLKTAIRSHIENEEAQKYKTALRKKMKKELALKHPFKIPQSRIESLQKDCEELIAGEHFNSDAEKKEHEHKMLEEGKETIRVSFLLPKFIREENLPKPSPEKLRERIMSYMFNRYMEHGQNADPKELEYFAQVAENDLIVEEALDYLIEKATKENT